MTQDERVKKLAQFEIGWWKAHHRKEKGNFIRNMVSLYKLQFGISEESALSAVLKRKEAADYHDLAEDCEDAGLQASADIYWSKAEACLKEHFDFFEKI